MQDKKQARVEKLTSLFQEANKGLATYEEVAELVKSILKAIKDKEVNLDKKLTDKLAEILSTVEKREQKLEQFFAKLSKEQQDGMNFVYDKARSLRSIKGDRGEKGEEGRAGKDGRNGIDGKNGKDGKQGEAPEHEWDDTKLRFKNPDGTWGEKVDLKGRDGVGGGGVTNLRIQQAFKQILKTESPTGAIDGVNLTYTLSQPIFAIFSMSINGEVIAQLPNYTISGRTFTFSTALPADYSGRDWEVKYI